jgi:50S ribosomal subunit-associated GTPase HflX
VANKMDEAVAEENSKMFKRKIRKTSVLVIAAAFDQGIETFKKTIREAVEETPRGCWKPSCRVEKLAWS